MALTIESIALALSVVNTIVGVAVFAIHCKGDKQRHLEISNKIERR